MRFKKIVEDYFTFTRNERKGIILLLVIIFLLAIANQFIFYFEKPAQFDQALFDQASRRLGNLNDSLLNAEGSSGRSLFPFDPNTIDSIALDTLALPENIRRNILKFRLKGGVFRSKEDFKRIYGVTDQIYNETEPFLIVESKESKKDDNFKENAVFKFDPNTCTDDEFTRLGLSSGQISTIRNYLKKGGHFYRREDFLKIWGLKDGQKMALAEYISINDSVPESRNQKSSSQQVTIDLNTADSVLLKSLPGIGEKLSKRIVKYRELLGGFYSINQLKEVFGLDEKTISEIEGKLTIDRSKIRKIDLNFSDMNQLARHPYVQKSLARQILNFRSRYGNIQKPEILLDSMILNIENFNRLKPYL